MDRPIERPASYYTSSNPVDLAEQADTHTSVEAEHAKDAARHSAIEDAQAGAKLRGFNDPAEEAGYGRETERAKIEAPVRAAQASGMSALERYLIGQRESDQRNSDNIASREKIAGNAETGKSARAELPPANMANSLAKAQSAYQQSGSGLRGMFHMGADSKSTADYTAQLEAELQRSGDLQSLQQAVIPGLSKIPGKTLDERIQASGRDFSQMRPEERAYLQLKLGIQ